jgi:hypothetical protein
MEKIEILLLRGEAQHGNLFIVGGLPMLLSVPVLKRHGVTT